MNLQGRPVSIVGAAKSGIAAARSLVRLGAKVFLSDIQSPDKVRSAIAAAGIEQQVEFEGGGHTSRLLQADFIVLSQGVRPDIPILQEAVRQGIAVHSEIEIAYRLSKGRRLVVTGSNGKTTTTTLLGLFCETHFQRVLVGGNIGIPMMEFATETREGDIQVLEVSSFQLETISTFRPDIGLITNFFENHLDRYPDYASYCSAKERLALNMGPDQWLVLNADQEMMGGVAERVQGRKAWFGWDLRGRAPGVTCRDGWFLHVHQDGREERLFPESAVKLIGRHNRENVMAAAMVALLAGVPGGGLEAAVASFPGVEHRLEWVRTLRGVTYINDSKGTNCAASMIALRACPQPVILIAGGRDKGTDLQEWVGAVRSLSRGVVLYGEARERFRAALEGLVPIKTAAGFAEAVDLAAAWAQPGDTVLLSPACSSYDSFPNFEVRGKAFKELVLALSSV